MKNVYLLAFEQDGKRYCVRQEHPQHPSETEKFSIKFSVGDAPLAPVQDLKLTFEGVEE